MKFRRPLNSAQPETSSQPPEKPPLLSQRALLILTIAIAIGVLVVERPSATPFVATVVILVTLLHNITG